jgi:hypothetical protein
MVGRRSADVECELRRTDERESADRSVGAFMGAIAKTCGMWCYRMERVGLKLEWCGPAVD